MNGNSIAPFDRGRFSDKGNGCHGEKTLLFIEVEIFG
jgi:hypothetical protein